MFVMFVTDVSIVLAADNFHIMPVNVFFLVIF